MNSDNERWSNLKYFTPYFDRWILIGSLVVMMSSILMWQALEKITERIKQDVGKSLQTVLETTHHNIEEWYQHHVREAYHHANLPVTVALIKAQLRLSKDKKNLLGSSYLQELRNNYNSSLLSVQSLGFFVISPQEINIGSLRDENMAKVNLLAGKYLDNIFEGKSQLILPVRSDVPLPDINGKLIADQPTMFIGVPVYDHDGTVIAAFTTRIDPALHFTQFTRIARIGETGETYAFNENGELITQSRFADQLRKLGLISPNEGGILSLKLHDPGGNMLTGYRPGVARDSLPLTKMARQALSGHNGLDLDGYRDYRGVEVIGAWCWLDELNIGLAVEVNVAEVYQSLDIIHWTMITTLGVSLFLFTCLASAIISRNRKLHVEIREHKFTEHKLRHSEEKLQAIIDNSIAIIYVKDLQGRYLMVNRGFEDRVNINRGEIEGKTDHEIFPKELAVALRENDLKVLSSKQPIQFEEVLYIDASRVDSISIKFPLCDGSGAIVAVGCISTDITERKRIEDELGRHRESLEELVRQRTEHLQHEIEERKRAEHSLRTSVMQSKAILAASIDPLITCDHQGVIQSASDSVAKVFGWRPDELVGNNVNTLIPDPYYSAHNEKFECSQRSARSEESEDLELPREYQGLRKDGSRFPCEATITRVDIPDQDEPMFTGILRDLTEQKRAEQEKKELHGQLLQTQKMEAVGTLAGGIAHDFNNILTSVLGYAELAEYQLPAHSPVLDNLHEIKSAANRAVNLVQQILTFSRHEESLKVPVDLSALVNEVLKFLRPVLPASIEVQCRIKKSNCMIFADPTQIHQVLMNLCTNASAAMRESGGVLELILDQIEVAEGSSYSRMGVPSGSYNELRVRDTGEGIEEAIIDKIFDPFFTTKEVGEGTGLGLSVVHSIIEDHEGTIKVDSKPGAGTTFTILLPRGESTQPADQVVTDVSYSGTERILFVDDEEMITRVSKQLLESIGYKVVETNSSQEALEIFTADPDGFDLVVTDQTMPSMTGDQLVTEILAVRPDLPIILCTGFSDKIDEKKAHQLGVRHYLTKPTSLSTLSETIRSVLE